MKVPVATFLLFFFHVCIDRLPDNGQNGEGAFFFVQCHQKKQALFWFCAHLIVPLKKVLAFDKSKKASSFLVLCSLNRTTEEGTCVRQNKLKQVLFGFVLT